MFTSITAAAILFILQIYLGIVFTLHGSQKVFGLFGGSGLSGWVEWLKTMQVPSFLAYTAAFVELLGGIMLLLGISPHIGALLEICMLIGAIYLVHWPHGFFIQKNGFEYSLLLMICCFLIILGGSSAWIVWEPIKIIV